jgi:ABC-type Fe3+ transport system permease subunit
VPILAIVFLGWKAGMLLVVYYVDLMVSWTAHMMAIVWKEQKDVYGNALAVILMICLFGVVLGLPVAVAVKRDDITFDLFLAIACLVQAGLAVASRSSSSASSS